MIVDAIEVATTSDEECSGSKCSRFNSWAKLSAMLEPENLTRRVYGFDTFAGFPSVSEQDRNAVVDITRGGLAANSHDELLALIGEFDKDRFLGHVDKAHLVKGDVCESIPRFVAEHPHLLVSLLLGGAHSAPPPAHI
ncbi:MAG: hypothetical protein NTU67_12815 [Gemmatimonadetes bacterium]|nr:hypothetical protein [Gemmatimonadota bacterium]